MSKYWTCPCGTRNERVKQKCTGEGCDKRRPKARVAKHARTLRDDPYPVYEVVNAELHAAAFGGEWTPDCCGVCGKPPKEGRHNDRDHDHRTGRPRGLACPGNTGCNILMLPWVTAATAAGIARVKHRAGEPDAERWSLISAYLERVEARDRSVAA